MTLDGARVLITGANGSIGQALSAHLGRHNVLPTDVVGVLDLDVTSPSAVYVRFMQFKPTLVFHLAGAKHAQLGEEDPAEAAKINITGTSNVLYEAAKYGARVVTASTCKACNPETAYGATKLIAERMTLNAGGSVARFFNVRESSGNVFELWRDLPESAPIPVTPCLRRFMSMDDAVRLLIHAAEAPSGRYTVSTAKLQAMAEVASETWPGRQQVKIAPRRGDRREEPALSSCEWVSLPVGGIVQVTSPHDIEHAREEVAA